MANISCRTTEQFTVNIHDTDMVEFERLVQAFNLEVKEIKRSDGSSFKTTHLKIGKVDIDLFT